MSASSVRSAQKLEKVFAIVSGDDFVKTLVRGVGLQGGERVRELGDEIFGVVAWLCDFCAWFSGFALLVHARFFGCALAGYGWRKLECRRLEGVHLEAYVSGIFALFDRFEP